MFLYKSDDEVRPWTGNIGPVRPWTGKTDTTGSDARDRWENYFAERMSPSTNTTDISYII